MPPIHGLVPQKTKCPSIGCQNSPPAAGGPGLWYTLRRPLQCEMALAKRTDDQLALFGREHLPMSPVRRQYLDLKQRNPDAILFFRLGDFFETFDQDAQIVARELEIALTARDLGRGERVPMAGVPCSAVDGYAARLVARGYRIAYAEQLSEPDGRGPVQRGVVRVISPGTVVEDGLLSPRHNSYLAALLVEGRQAGLAHLDVSTGYLATTEMMGPQLAELLSSELCRIGPSECLLNGEAVSAEQQ